LTIVGTLLFLGVLVSGFIGETGAAEFDAIKVAESPEIYSFGYWNFFFTSVGITVVTPFMLFVLLLSTIYVFAYFIYFSDCRLFVVSTGTI
jgi:hypothetical protein